MESIMQNINELTYTKTEAEVCAFLDEQAQRMKKNRAEVQSALIMLKAELKEKQGADRRNNK
jgi:hypothetical protein